MNADQTSIELTAGMQVLDPCLNFELKIVTFTPMQKVYTALQSSAESELFDHVIHQICPKRGFGILRTLRIVNG